LGDAHRGSLGLRGWVRNRSDGSVEALVTGAPEQIAAMIEAWRSGPIGAHVTEGRTAPSEDDGRLGFIQSLRFRAARNSGSTVSKTGACAVTKRSRSKGSPDGSHAPEITIQMRNIGERRYHG
jgi:acylphosphatase